MWDVIVVGARTAGAPLAMLLARAGLRVLLVDRTAFPSDTLSTHQVTGRCSRSIRGLLDTIAAVTPATAQIRLDVGGAVGVAGRCPNMAGSMRCTAAPCWTPSSSTARAPPEQDPGKVHREGAAVDQRLRDRHPGTRARWGSVTETARSRGRG